MDSVINAAVPGMTLLSNSAEYFKDDKKKDKKKIELTPEELDMLLKIDRFAYVISLIVGIYAFSLSWQCNNNVPTFLRIVYAVFAFWFGLVYLLYYFLFRGECQLDLKQ